QYARGQRGVELQTAQRARAQQGEAGTGEVEIIQRDEAAVLAALFDETLRGREILLPGGGRNAEAEHVVGQAGLLDSRRKLLEELRRQHRCGAQRQRKARDVGASRRCINPISRLARLRSWARESEPSSAISY